MTNSSVESALDGVVFGPYANGGAQGGSLVNTKVAGMKVSDIGHLAYTAKWSNDEGIDVGVPYLRLFLENGSRMIFSPNTQPVKDTAPGAFHKWTVHTGTVRYDDDKGNGADMTGPVRHRARLREGQGPPRQRRLHGRHQPVDHAEVARAQQPELGLRRRGVVRPA